MSREEAKLELQQYQQQVKPSTRFYKVMDMAISALEQLSSVTQKPIECEDAISREAALEAVSEGCQEWRGIYGRCEELINALPSVTQKSGKWIDEGWYAEGHSEHAYRCSECDEHYIGYVGEYNYCPNCGAKMESEDKE